MFPLDKIQPPPYLKNDLEDCAEELHHQYFWPEERRFQNLLDAYEGDEGW